MMRRLLLVYTVLAMLNSASWAATCHVAPGGDDNNPGTEKRPFKSFAKAVPFLAAGGTCIVHEGRYTEPIKITGYQKTTPIYIKVAEGARVILDGREPVKGAWTRHKDSIYRTAVTGAVEQVFFRDQMMVEARWPNMKFPDELWDRSKWASAARGSRKGLMVSHDLATTGVNWTGALAVLNLYHQWWTWTSSVSEHTAGRDRFRYDFENLIGIIRGKHPFHDDRYYLAGILAALDTSGEWHHDREKGLLYVWTPDGKRPLKGSISVKRRQHGLVVKNSSNVHISGIHFLGCAFHLSKVSHCVIEDCHLRYPGFSREITERLRPRREAPCAFIEGDHNAVRKCSIGYSSGTGLRVKGACNVIENNLVHDVCWSGSLDYNAIRVDGRYGETTKGHNVIRRNTLLNGGNALIHMQGPGNIVELNHIYDGGRACLDVALVYTLLPLCERSEIRYNWVHGCFAPNLALGIRGDGKTRRLRVHHNVTWDCGWEGIVVKGDENLVYNNTGFRNGGLDILLYSRPEPHKPWHGQWPSVPDENKHSKVFNNLGRRMRGDRSKNILPGGEFVNNHQTAKVTSLLRNAKNHDFRPRPGCVLVDKGIVKDGLPAEFAGRAPDIGAYESEDEPWIPGITWDPGKILGYRPEGYQ